MKFIRAAQMLCWGLQIRYCCYMKLLEFEIIPLTVVREIVFSELK